MVVLIVGGYNLSGYVLVSERSHLELGSELAWRLANCTALPHRGHVTI